MNVQHKKIENIYLAGKIESRDWRHDIVTDLREKSPLRGECGYIFNGAESPWPVQKNAIFGQYHYTGPYFVTDVHGSSFLYHGEGTHGLQSREALRIDNDFLINQYVHGESYEGIPYRTILVRCTQAICHSDLVFAWIDDLTCYGTIAEIGMAYQEDKIIWIAGPRRYRDLEFVYQMAWRTHFEKNSPKFVLQRMLSEYQQHQQHFDSPIEQSFWDAWLNIGAQTNFPLTPQHPIGKYRVDFAHLPTMTSIELDGFSSHSSTEDIAKDRKRQREIEAAGWHVIRFGGKEIHNNAKKCASEVEALLFKRDLP